MKKTGRILFSLVLTACSFLSGCKTQFNNHNTFIIWTDRKEFVSYCELFNSQQNKIKAVVIYKQRLANSLPPARDEEKPDLVVGSWLKNDRTRKNFKTIDNILSADSVNTTTMYPYLIEYGKAAGKQYLLPVSFNLPLVIFSTKNESMISDKYALTFDQIRDIAGEFNKTGKNDVYTKMGFAPSWEKEFVYEVTKQFGQCFKEKGTSFTWNNEHLKDAVAYIRNWTKTKNKSTTAEQDYEFKYLYTPPYRYVNAGHSLFAYTTSNELFNIPFEQLGEIDYRWIKINGALKASDEIVSMAIYSKAKNPEYAETFIKWFFREENQKSMIERTEKMHLDTSTFGIASGFSSIIDVNEHLFPTYYRNLLGNLPDSTAVKSPQGFPARWESLRERVIYPYLMSAINTDSDRQESMQNLLNAWSKQFD